MSDEIRRTILLIEDDPVCARVVQQFVNRKDNNKYWLRICDDLTRGLARLAHGDINLVLLDLGLPDSKGLSTLKKLREENNEVPVIVLTTIESEEMALSALRNGAQDYLVKGNDLREDILFRTINYSLERHGLQKNLQRAQEERYQDVKQNHDNLCALLDQLRVGTAMTDSKGCIVFLSKEAECLFGVNMRTMIGKPWQSLANFKKNELHDILNQIRMPSISRCKITVEVEKPSQTSWIEMEIQDDPRDPRRSFFFFYDVSEAHSLRDIIEEKAHFKDLLGASDKMKRVYQHIQEMAGVDVTVLLQGDTGTGKELVARALHDSSSRAKGPFVALNCAGLSPSLLESQLFGHRKGAFTGAISDQQGLMEAAVEGTLFLDEIGDVPERVQTNLLRVLQEREILRIGDTVPKKIDVRIIAATHRNLKEEVDNGNFRKDLYYRIKVAHIDLPALRQRKTDIPLLAQAFLQRQAAVLGKRIDGISQGALNLLMEHDWPGNVRELKSAIEYGAIRCKSNFLKPEELPREIREISDEAQGLHLVPVPREQEVSDIRNALEQTQGNRSAAARLLGMSRATFYRRLSELDLVSNG